MTSVHVAHELLHFVHVPLHANTWFNPAATSLYVHVVLYSMNYRIEHDSIGDNGAMELAAALWHNTSLQGLRWGLKTEIST